MMGNAETRKSKVTGALNGRNRLLWWLKQQHNLTDDAIKDLLQVLRTEAFGHDDVATSPYVLREVGRVCRILAWHVLDIISLMVTFYQCLFPSLQERETQVTETKTGQKKTLYFMHMLEAIADRYQTPQPTDVFHPTKVDRQAHPFHSKRARQCYRYLIINL